MDVITEPRVFERMAALGDSARSRLMVLLEQGEFTVTELTRILQLPQSTVSRHLKVLSDDGWVTSRASGTSNYYRRAASLDRHALDLWELVRADVVASGLTARDAERAQAVLAQRRERSRAFFASSAGRWDRLREDLFGPEPDALGLMGLLDPDWTIGDLGAGTGQFAARVAPFVRRVIAVDASAQMRATAARRVERFDNVEIRAGELEQLPIADGELDLAVALLVLHYLVEPDAVLGEVRRALAPGGRVVVVDMRRHTRDGYREEMGHVWPGFEPRAMVRWFREAGFCHAAVRPVPPRPEASGPPLFVASAEVPSGGRLDRRSREEPEGIADPSAEGRWPTA